jgi:T5SS/PEP-CTERM-associated repeat protein
MIADGYDLVIDAQHGTTQTIRLNNQPGQDIQIDLKLDSHYTLGAGYLGAGSLTIRDGVKVVSNDGFISYYGGSSGNAEVSGEGTEWRIHSYLNIGGVGDGILTIRDDALVMTENLWTGFHDEDSGKSFINMANGGKFAIKGKLYPTSVTLAEFYEVFIPFSDPLPEVIRYWDAQSNSWSDLFNATLGEDYTLEYFDTGDLAGYTVLTVHTPLPEPNTAAVLWLGLTAFLHQRRGR